MKASKTLAGVLAKSIFPVKVTGSLQEGMGARLTSVSGASANLIPHRAGTVTTNGRDLGRCWGQLAYASLGLHWSHNLQKIL